MRQADLEDQQGDRNGKDTITERFEPAGAFRQ
jgi:hypothetical protein